MARRFTIAILVAVVLSMALPAFAATYTICHAGRQTLTGLDEATALTHIVHGDYVGPCRISPSK
jgi:hypothetical protein